MFDQLETIYHRPQPFEFYTANELWTDEHTSAQMLAYHLNEDVDLSSRNGAFIDRSVEWIVSDFGVGEGTWHVHNGGWSADSKQLVYTQDKDYGDIYELVEKR